MRIPFFSKSDPSPQASADPGMELASVTINQLLDVLSSGGDGDLVNLYGVAPFGIRNSAVSFPTYFRVITLLSSMIAQVITGGALRIMDNSGRVVTTPRAKRILEIMSYSVDGELSAYSWMEDWASDYLIEGNALAEVARSATGGFLGLRHLQVQGADLIVGREGGRAYRAKYLDSARENPFAYIGARSVAHARWPRVLRSASTGSGLRRFHFAAPPVQLLRTALEIGLAGDRYIREWYMSGGAHRSNIGIALKERLQPEQVEQFQKLFAASQKTRSPLLMGGGASFSNLSQAAANKDQADLREFQVSDLGRTYGIPGPILNQQVTQWGSGIEQLAKLFWRFGLRQHVERVLVALSFRILPPGQRFGVNDADILRGDAASVAALVTASQGDAQRPETATREERRIWFGLPIEPEHGTLREMPEPEPPPDPNNPEPEPGDSNDGTAS